LINQLIGPYTKIRTRSLSPEVGQTLIEAYDKVSGMLVTMIRNSHQWTTPKP